MYRVRLRYSDFIIIINHHHHHHHHHYHILERKDPVSKFHQNNGASVLRINWSADDSEWRMKESFGMMVNYHYD